MTATIKTFCILLVTGLFFSCGNSKDGMKTNNESSNSEKIIPIKLSDFHAEAPNSSWILRVQFGNQLYFKDENKGISFKGDIQELHVAQGADVVGISAKNSSHVLRLSIDIVDCGDGGKNVDIMLRKKDKNDGNNYSGCGYYRGNPKLHDIWAVKSINGERLNPEKFPKDIPHFEINLEEKKLGGFAGCNQVFGQLSFEYNKIIIKNLGSTKMYCEGASKIENKLLSILRAKPVIYSLKGTALILENTEGSIELKKVD